MPRRPPRDVDRKDPTEARGASRGAGHAPDAGEAAGDSGGPRAASTTEYAANAEPGGTPAEGYVAGEALDTPTSAGPRDTRDSGGPRDTPTPRSGHADSRRTPDDAGRG